MKKREFIFSFVFIFSGWLLLTGALVNVYEKDQETDESISGVVGAVHENYIAIAYTGHVRGVEQEIGFERSSEVQLIHKPRWDQIRPGEEVIAGFMEIRKIREGKTDSGELGRENFITKRVLKSLEFTEPKKRQLVSGV